VTGNFLAVAGGGYLHCRHLEPPPATPLGVARRFAGAPYLWGGRTPLGVDCSGLVQVALAACGIAAPRDSDQQRDELGIAVDLADRRGGDLVFFPGHVGILVDADTLFHANAYWMATVEEPLADVLARGAEVVAVRRIVGRK
jgi:cell wall-associated NlpC family hydrolase